MTATALLLDGRASHRAIGAEDAAVARLRLKQCLAVRALVEILTRVRRHDFFPRLSAARAGEYGLQDYGAHGFAMSFEGNPASVVAWVKRAVLALSGSNVTVAVFLSKSTAVAVTPGTFSRAFFTTMGQVPQVIFSTAKVAVWGGAAKAAPAASDIPSAHNELTIKLRIVISFSSRTTGRTTGMLSAPPVPPRRPKRSAAAGAVGADSHKPRRERNGRGRYTAAET